MDSFFSRLFDFSFERFITTSLVKVLYILALVATTIYALAIATVITAPIGGLLKVLVAILVVPVVFLLGAVYARVLLELAVVLFRIGESTSSMSAALERMASRPASAPDWRTGSSRAPDEDTDAFRPDADTESERRRRTKQRARIAAEAARQRQQEPERREHDDERDRPDERDAAQQREDRKPDEVPAVDAPEQPGETTAATDSGMDMDIGASDDSDREPEQDGHEGQDGHDGRSASQGPEAGWYPDPGGSDYLRYWDGRDWTDRLREG